jgi:tRNA dimethylallyltransferase
MTLLPPVIVIAGPTASGKSALAIRVAEEFGGVVINADSMQVYDGLRVITSRPSEADESRSPHRLYGFLSPDQACSAGRWRALAEAECEAAWAVGRLPVVVGGTGLYLRALAEGLSPVPDIPEAVRRETRALFAGLGNAAFHDRLAARDPTMAARLHPSNSQRLMRAWEVVAATGRSLADWQSEPDRDRLAARFFTVAVVPPRDDLYTACDRRFLVMLERGALDEVRRLLDLRLAPTLPAMRALGVPELVAHLTGQIEFGEAVGRAQRSTRNYAKRQLTWLRHQAVAQFTLAAQFSESFEEKIFSVIRRFLLTPP